jgi:hypothetical protein
MVWALIEIYAFSMVLHGFDVMRPEGLWAASGWWVAGGILAVVGLRWTKITTWLNPRFVAIANLVATDFRWWIGTAMVILLVGTFSRFIEERRWPFSLAKFDVSYSTSVPESMGALPVSELNLKTALQHDFPGTWQSQGEMSLPTDGNQLKIIIIDFRDPHNGAEFLGAYLPRATQTFSIIKQILIDHKSLLKLGHSGVSESAYGQEGNPGGEDVVFTKRIFIYYESELSLQQRAELEKISESLGVKTVLRGVEYLATEKVYVPKESEQKAK